MEGEAYMVYPAATISLPGLKTSSKVPLESAAFSFPKPAPSKPKR